MAFAEATMNTQALRAIPAPGGGPVRRRAPAAVVPVCCATLAAVVFAQRLVVPLGGEQSVTCLLPVAWLSMGTLLAIGGARVDLPAACGCAAFLATALVSQIMGGQDFSAGSFALLVAIYVLCPIRIVITEDEYIRILRFFQSCLVLVALATLGQYASQLAGRGMPILENILPERVVVKNFVYMQEIVYASGFYKPNALVMLEASFLSQFVGLALVIEFWFFRRNRYLMLFGAVLVLTFSGTGMILAGATLALMISRRGIDRTTTILIGVAVCMAAGLVATGYLDSISNRVAEFSDSNASASVRFIRPLERVYEVLSSGDGDAVLWGYGAGFIDREIGYTWNPPVKVLVEYGLITCIAYWGYMATLIRAPFAPILASGLVLEYLLLGGGALLQPPVVLACLFLGIGYTKAGTRPGVAPGRAALRAGSGHPAAKAFRYV